MQNTILIDCSIITRAAPMSNKFSVFVGISLSIRQNNNAAQPVLDLQARRVDSVEGGSFMFWEVFFSARGASL